MDANHRHNSVYYRCYPSGNNRARPDRHLGHPKMVYINEKVLLEALDSFYNDRVFGPHRRELLAAELDGLDDTAAQQRQHERERHQRVLADITRRQHNLMRQAQDAEPGDPFAAGLRDSYNQLEADRIATLATIDQLDAQGTNEPAKPTAADAALLDALPRLRLNLARAPQHLQRKLYEATQLKIELDHETAEVTMTIRLPADQTHNAARAARALSEPRGQPTSPAVVDAVGAPGRNRTCDTRFRKPMLYPLSYEGIGCIVAGSGVPGAAGRRRGMQAVRVVGLAELYEVIHRRRDVRGEFTGAPLEPEVLRRVLAAAHAAPSVGLSQPWDFVLVRDVPTREAFREHVRAQRRAFAETLNAPEAEVFERIKIEGILEATLGVVVTYDPARGAPAVLGRHTIADAGLYSVCLAIQNLWLAATVEGLGVGWVSFYTEEFLAGLLGLPSGIRPVAWLCLGPVSHLESTPDLERHGWRARRPLELAVHEGRWGNH